MERLLATETPIVFLPRVTSPFRPVNMTPLKQPGDRPTKPPEHYPAPIKVDWLKRLEMIVQTPTFWMFIILLYAITKK